MSAWHVRCEARGMLLEVVDADSHDLCPDHPHPRPNLRERAQTWGAASLSDAELIALLLSTGSRETSAHALAAHLLEKTRGLTGLGRLGLDALAEVRGIGLAKASRLAAALELAQRICDARLMDAPRALDSFEHVADWARPRLAGLEHEEVWLLCLDARNGLKSARAVARGGLHGCALTARDVLAPALRDNASAIVLVHNHPSGDPQPSTEDLAMTGALSAAAELVGIPLLDHVIVARQGAVSLLALGAVR